MKIVTILKWLFAVLGAGMLIGAAVSLVHTRSFLAQASRAQGTVVALQPRHSRHTNTNGTNSSDTGDSVTFAPLVRFSYASQVIDFTSSSSSNPPSYRIGETVRVLFLESNPSSARIDSFFPVWGATVILSSLGSVFFLIGGGMIIVPRMGARADERLLQEGIPVEATFVSVDRNPSVTVNGRNPFRITAQWQDPATLRVYVFVSRNIWFDPTPYVQGKSVKVYIARGNPKKYYVDLSFLPELAS
jgi:hypothetical protein